MKSGKILKRIFFVIAIAYVTTTFVNQQRSLNAYKNEQEALNQKIAQQKEYKSELLTTKENISSPEYIEQIAREKLDMYLPNEKVYIDISK